MSGLVRRRAVRRWDGGAGPVEWMRTRTGTIEGRRVIAMDGRSARGARTGQASEPLDLDGAAVTADAMRTRAGAAEWITRRGDHRISGETPRTSRRTSPDQPPSRFGPQRHPRSG